jgi:hypothetical protein
MRAKLGKKATCARIRNLTSSLAAKLFGNKTCACAADPSGRRLQADAAARPGRPRAVSVCVVCTFIGIQRFMGGKGGLFWVPFTGIGYLFDYQSIWPFPGIYLSLLFHLPPLLLNSALRPSLPFGSLGAQHEADNKENRVAAMPMVLALPADRFPFFPRRAHLPAGRPHMAHVCLPGPFWPVAAAPQ